MFRPTHRLTAAGDHDGLVQLIKVDLLAVNEGRRLDRLAARPHDLEQRLHEELRVELLEGKSATALAVKTMRKRTCVWRR